MAHLLACQAAMVPALKDTVDRYTPSDTATEIARDKLRPWLPVATAVVTMVPLRVSVSAGGTHGMHVEELPQPAVALERASKALFVLVESPGSLQAVLSLERAVSQCAAVVVNTTGFEFLKAATDKYRGLAVKEKAKEEGKEEKKKELEKKELEKELEKKERDLEREQKDKREKDKREREEQEKKKGKGKEVDGEEAKANKKEKKEREKREREEQEKREKREQEKREQKEQEKKEEQQKKDKEKGKGKEVAEEKGGNSAEWRIEYGVLALTVLPDLLCALCSEMTALIPWLQPPPVVPHEEPWETQQSAVHSGHYGAQPGYTKDKIVGVLNNMHVCDPSLTAVLQACVVLASETLVFMPLHHLRPQLAIEFPTEGSEKRFDDGRKLALAATQVKLMSRAVDALWRMGKLKGAARMHARACVHAVLRACIAACMLRACVRAMKC
jgi:hypothetical protein